MFWRFKILLLSLQRQINKTRKMENRKFKGQAYPPESFWGLYRNIPEEKPLTPKQRFIKKIAEATGANESSVGTWLRSGMYPGRKAQQAIADVLGKPLDVVFPESE